MDPNGLQSYNFCLPKVLRFYRKLIIFVYKDILVKKDVRFAQDFMINYFLFFLDLTN